jgi:hypothetical protein
VTGSCSRRSASSATAPPIAARCVNPSRRSKTGDAQGPRPGRPATTESSCRAAPSEVKSTAGTPLRRPCERVRDT